MTIYHDTHSPPSILINTSFTDPFFVALVGGQLELLPLLINAMIGEIAFKIGDMYGAFNEEGTMVGFQAWTPPGKMLLES